MSVFPGAIPVFAGFTSTHTLATDNHAAQHNLEQAEIVNIATKIGTGSSTPASGLVLTSGGTGTSSWSQVSLTSMVSGVLPIANGGTAGSSLSAARSSLSVYSIAEIDALITATKSALYPVGSIYTETTGVNPATGLGFGTWSAFGAGRVLVGKASSGTFGSAGATGGEETHILTSTEMPSHTHTQNSHIHQENVATTGGGGLTGITGTASLSGNTGASQDTGSTTATNQNTGGDGAHNNLQPYIVVYMWQRTA